MPFLFDKVVIVGVGLIGSSIGMNLIKRKLAKEVIGVGRDRANLREAIRRRAIHRAVGATGALSLLSNFSENDLVILATPVRGIIRYLKILPNIPLVMDVGSTKSSIVKAAEKNQIRFVGSHPITGTEKSGAGAGEIDLFRKRVCILVPSRFSGKKGVPKIRRFWELLGSRVITTDAARHDRLLAVLSHLPHTIAYTLVRTVSRLVSKKECGQLAFGSLKGMTRVAESPPEMWHDIFLENRDLVLKELDLYLAELTKLKSFLLKKDSARLLRYLRQSQKIRLQMK